MRSALTAAIVSALIATSIGGAAVGISQHDRQQDRRIAAQRETIRSLRTEARSTQAHFGRVEATLKVVYGASVICLRPEYQPVVVRPDGTLATPAAGETPTARVALVSSYCWNH